MGGTPSVFNLLKGRMMWLAKRQDVISQNIVQSRKPGYLPKDVKSFKKSVESGQTKGLLPMTQTSGRHIPIGPTNVGVSRFETEISVDPRDISHAGNGVVLEEQLLKSTETNIQFKETGAILDRYIKMRRHALGKK